MNTHLVVLIGTACVGGLLFGYDTGIVSGAMIQIKSDPREHPDVGGFDLSSAMQGAVVSITTVGAAIGSILSGPLSQAAGRRIVCLGAAVLFVPSCLVMAFAQRIGDLLFGRLMVGVGIGFAATTVPIYIAETAPPEVRGSLVTLNTICIVFGQVAASLVACGYDVAHTPEGWRWMLGWGAAPGVVMFLGFLFLPETPRWLAANGDLPAAASCLRYIRPAADLASQEEELAEIRASVAAEAVTGTPTYASIFKDVPVVRALYLGCGLQLLQQVTGINTVMYYSASILQSSSKSTHLSPFAPDNVEATCMSAVIASSQMVGVCVGMVLIDYCGRKTLVLSSLAGVTVFLVALGGVFFAAVSHTKSLAAVAMCCYLVSFGIGMSAIPWVFNAEVYPLRVRATCVSIATAVNWIASFVVSASFLSLSEAISTDRVRPKDYPNVIFWLYAACGAVGFYYLRRYMPETKGLTLEEITQLFEGRYYRPEAAKEELLRLRKHAETYNNYATAA
ncbi:Inositol transporter 1 [Diplonema papillatum]|nr:Inositol transporter 1 [Diplonema papillatum]|eukprot:gene21052-32440_t